MKHSFLTILMVTALYGCGGGSEAGDETAIAAPTPEGNTQTSVSDDPTTEELVADADFDFRLDRVIELIVTDPGEPGALHIYHRSEVADVGVIAFDPMSRITTIRPDIESQWRITINNTWEQLIVHWVPMTAAALEQIQTVPLDASIERYEITL